MEHELEAPGEGVRPRLFLVGLGVSLLYAWTLGVVVAHIPAALAWSFGLAGTASLAAGIGLALGTLPARIRDGEASRGPLTD